MLVLLHILYQQPAETIYEKENSKFQLVKEKEGAIKEKLHVLHVYR